MVDVIPTPDRPLPDIGGLLQQQRLFFATQQTQSFDFRLAQLRALRQMVVSHQADIVAALQADLRKPALESYLSEIAAVKEIDFAIRQLRDWMKPSRVAIPFEQWPATGRIQPQPLGVVLIMGAWNYPFQLMITPLVGAIAAGNCAILKPSELAIHTSRLLAELIGKTFDPAYVAVVEGDLPVSQALLAERFDHIFFTGGATVGKIVMAAAAQHLTPVTLELGGKSPCIVDGDVDVAIAARRIVWGKFFNTGQTCIAPDYLLVDRRIKAELLAAIRATLLDFYGADPAQSPDYGRIINEKQFNRLAGLLAGLLQSNSVAIGGEVRPEERYIAPTVLDPVTVDAPIMQEEIFGPLLPVLEYGDVEEAIAQINARPKPLALYIFSRNSATQTRLLEAIPSGNAVVNDTLMQFAIPTLAFGGVGDSGMGRYHGKAGFDTFSQFRSVLVKPLWWEIPWRYAAYRGWKMALVQRVLGVKE